MFWRLLPALQQLKAAPAYCYLGGLIVAACVVMISILVPSIGVGAATSLIVTGQVICAVLIDHFGLFNVTVQSVILTCLGGVLLMIARIYL